MHFEFDMYWYQDRVNLSEMTRLEAEVYFISMALRNICSSWEPLADFFNGLLQGEDNILSSASNDQLVYDEGVFSLSRTYFWAIDTLTRIESLITSNIHKWTSYKKDRIDANVKKSKNTLEIV